VKDVTRPAALRGERKPNFLLTLPFIYHNITLLCALWNPEGAHKGRMKHFHPLNTSFFIFSYSVRELRDDDFLIFQRFLKKEIGISLYRVCMIIRKLSPRKMLYSAVKALY